MSAEKRVPPHALSFAAFPLALKKKKDDKDKRRKFSGIANSGKPLKHWYWDLFIIDMESVEFSHVTPGLIDHDSLRRAAVGSLSIEDGGLFVDGALLSNEHGQAIADDADDGFPWQLSVHVEPGSIEEVVAGTEVEINGQSLTGPISIFRNAQIREFSFTPVGVDGETAVNVLSRADDYIIPVYEVSTSMAKNTRDGDNNPSIEQLQAEKLGLSQRLNATEQELEKAKVRAEAAETKLAAIQKEQRETEVRALLAVKGTPWSEAAADPYMKMSDEIWAAVRDIANDLSANAQPANTQPGLPPQFFQRETGVQQSASLSTGANPLIEDAKRRAKQAA